MAAILFSHLSLVLSRSGVGSLSGFIIRVWCRGYLDSFENNPINKNIVAAIRTITSWMLCPLKCSQQAEPMK